MGDDFFAAATQARDWRTMMDAAAQRRAELLLREPVAGGAAMQRL